MRFSVAKASRAFALSSLPVVGLVLCSIYSWFMTASGLFYSGYIPESLISLIEGYEILDVSSDIIVSAFAAVIIQMGIFIAYMTLSITKNIFRLSIFVMVPVFISLVIFSGFMSTFSILLNSRGESLKKGFENNIISATAEASAVDAQMVSIFSGQIAAYKNLADQSRRGFDESGISRCGPICKEMVNKSRAVEREYSAALSERIEYIKTGRTASELFSDSQNTLIRVEQRFEVFRKFCLSENIDCPIIEFQRGIEKASSNISEVGLSILKSPPDRNLIVLDETARVFFRPITWMNEALNFIVPLFISFIPDLGSVIFMLALRSRLTGEVRADQLAHGEVDKEILEQELRQSEERSELLRRLFAQRMRENLEEESLDAFDEKSDTRK